MQFFCLPRHCQYLHQHKLVGAKVRGISPIHFRRFASHSSPGFGSNRPPTTGPKAFRSKPSTSSQSRTSKGNDGKGGKEPPEASGAATFFKKFPFSTRQIVILSLLACASYGLYTFQTDPHRSVILQPRFFTPFILDLREKVSSTSSILHLRSVPPGQNTDNVTEAWKTGIWSLQVMQPELQIARSYTPLPPEDGAEPEQLRLFVRKEPQGEVSTFLHRINRGTLVHLRGPQIEFKIPENLREVLFVAGGTGIAPALQVAHILYKCRTSSSTEPPKLRILWANRRSEDSYLESKTSVPKQAQQGLVSNTGGWWPAQAPKVVAHESEELIAPQTRPQTALVEEVEALKAKYPGQVQVEYFVDENNSHITESTLRKYLSKSSEEITSDTLPNKRLLLISGPEGFVDFYAGPKLIKAGREVQGPLGGLLQRIKPNGWTLWKL